MFALALATSIATHSLAAQGVSWAQPVEKDRAYADLVRAGVDSALHRWERAADAHDAARMARIYASSAVLYPTFGNPFHGQHVIGDALAQVIGRIERPRWTITQLTASGEVAAIAAELDYQVAFPTGGSYERRERVQLAMRLNWNVGWIIEMQSGGDLAPTVAWADRPPTRVAAGDSVTLRVRVTDALGGGIPDVLVSFGADEAAGTVAPTGVRTDARGEASATLVAARAGGAGEIRATASIAPRDPALAVVTTLPPTTSAAEANGSTRSTSAPSPPIR